MSQIKQVLFLILIVPFIPLMAQDDRAQVPSYMQNAYFEVNIGSINYPFSQAQLEAGYSLTDAIVVPHTAVRLVLAGYDFNKYLSAQLTYMRPVLWVRYKYMNDQTLVSDNHSVWMNVGGLTLKPRLPIGEHFSIYGEAGLGIITRHGFEDPQGKSVVKDANYPTFLFGAGLKYHINNRWALQLVSNYSPRNEKHNQPYTSFVGGGFSYHLRPFSEKQIEKGKTSGLIHPKQWLQIGYTSNVLGYGVNNLVSRDPVPIFWGGRAEVRQGLSLNYQRNVFHGPRVFALDWGVNASVWQTKGEAANQFERQQFFTLSVFPVFRLNYWHAKKFDAYFYYTVAAPTYISETLLDGHKMGAKFTFMDNMGTGIFFGEKRNLNAEIKIGHYSNGNVFTDNEAVKIPLSLNVGYAF